MRTSLSAPSLILALATLAACGTSPGTPFDPDAVDIGGGDTATDTLEDVSDPDFGLPDVDQCPPTACVEEGPLECGRQGVIECVVAADGCLESVVVECGPDSACNPVTLTCSATGCQDEDDCEVGERFCGDVDWYYECILDARGCRVLADLACAEGVCVDGDDGATCVSDPCEGTEECRSETAFCNPDGLLISCGTDALGCATEETTDCVPLGGRCIETDAGATCEIVDPCGPAPCDRIGRFCDGDTLVECDFDALGCLQLQEFDCAEEGGFCDGDSCVIDPCGDVRPICDEEGRQCEDGLVVECFRDAAGCFDQRVLDCDPGTECREADGGAFCLEPCERECDASSFCVGNDLVTCAPDELGCLVADRRTSCGDLSCLESADGAECTEEAVCSGFPVCDPEDFAPVCEDEVTLIECRETRAGCFAEIPVTCAARGEICGETDSGFDCIRVPCGDGDIDPGEECDDGNGFNGDGCDFECTVEAGFFCAGEPSECVESECGDGEIGIGEGCEDGNDIGGDGCASDCVLEVPSRGGFAVVAGTIDSADEEYVTPQFDCREGFGSDGYDAYWWRNDTGAAQEVTVEFVGDFNQTLVLFDATWLPGEEPGGCVETVFGGFEDGNRSEPVVLAPGEILVTVLSSNDSDDTEYTLTMRSAGCGDGVIDAGLGEACDDGGSVAGDGCSADCRVEEGFVCDGEPSECRTPSCGDGIVDDPLEECDDNNELNGDGCDFECLVEPDFGCTGEPSECFPVVCGDGIIALTEGCEDGNTVSGDGCSATCEVELPASGDEAAVEGGLSSDDGTWIRPGQRCDAGSSERFYDAYWVVNPSADPIEIDIEVAFSFDGYLHVFDATFDPEEPTSGCLLGNDDDGGFNNSALRGVVVPAGESRVIVVSTFSRTAAGDYDITITGI